MFSFQTRDSVIHKTNIFSVGDAVEKELQSLQERHHQFHLVSLQMLHHAVYHVGDHVYCVADINFFVNVRELISPTVLPDHSTRLVTSGYQRNIKFKSEKLLNDNTINNY